jgi:hypothetical protein
MSEIIDFKILYYARLCGMRDGAHKRANASGYPDRGGHPTLPTHRPPPLCTLLQCPTLACMPRLCQPHRSVALNS